MAVMFKRLLELFSAWAQYMQGSCNTEP